MMIGALYGLIGAIEFVAPDLLGNISWLVFGRIRTVHTNLVIFGFVVPALLSVGHFIVPHLLKTELYSEKLGMLSVVIWNIFTAAILITLSMGMSGDLALAINKGSTMVRIGTDIFGPRNS